MKMYLNLYLLKLCVKYCRLFFPDTVYQQLNSDSVSHFHEIPVRIEFPFHFLLPRTPQQEVAHHAMPCLRISGLATSADVWQPHTQEQKISAALWASLYRQDVLALLLTFTASDHVLVERRRRDRMIARWCRTHLECTPSVDVHWLFHFIFEHSYTQPRLHQIFRRHIQFGPAYHTKELKDIQNIRQP